MRLFPSNPVSRAETTYLQRSTPRQRPWLRWLTRLITLSIFGLALGYISIYLACYFIAQIPPTDPILSAFLELGSQLLLPLAAMWVVGMHFRLMFQTLSLSANSISREHGGGTWDMLLLTAIDSNQIIRGKWQAIIQQQWRQYVRLGLLRGLMMSWMVTASYYDYYTRVYSSSVQYTGSFLLFVAGMLVTTGFIFLITLLNLGFTAACGLSASVDHHRGSVALARAAGTRSAILIGLFLIPFGIAYSLHLSFEVDTLASVLGNTAGYVLTTMVDNGVVLSYQALTVGFLQVYPYVESQYLLIVALAMVAAPILYIILTWAVLRFTRGRAIRAGALRPGHTLTVIAAK